jgi:sulfur relay protein TusB/DsrH
MLFLLNSLDAGKLKEIEILGGSEDKSVILYSDAAYYASPSMASKLSGFDFDEIYVSQDALTARNISPDDAVEAIDYDNIAEIIMDHDRVVSL